MTGLKYHQRQTAGMQEQNIYLSTLNNADSSALARISTNLCENSN